jgi:hypothetical protein
MRRRWDALILRVERLGVGDVETSFTAIERLWKEIGTPFSSTGFQLNDWGWAAWGVYKVCGTLKIAMQEGVGGSVYEVSSTRIRRELKTQTPRPLWLDEAVLLSYLRALIDAKINVSGLEQRMLASSEIHWYSVGRLLPRGLSPGAVGGSSVDTSSASLPLAPSVPLPEMEGPVVGPGRESSHSGVGWSTSLRQSVTRSSGSNGIGHGSLVHQTSQPKASGHSTSTSPLPWSKKRNSRASRRSSQSPVRSSSRSGRSPDKAASRSSRSPARASGGSSQSPARASGGSSRSPARASGRFSRGLNRSSSPSRSRSRSRSSGCSLQ